MSRLEVARHAEIGQQHGKVELTAPSEMLRGHADVVEPEVEGAEEAMEIRKPVIRGLQAGEDLHGLVQHLEALVEFA